MPTDGPVPIHRLTTETPAGQRLVGVVACAAKTISRRFEYTRHMTSFSKLNNGWNAEPNAPLPQVRVEGTDVVLSFRLKDFQFRQYNNGDIGTLRFARCTRYRLGSTNDEGWYLGQCRFRGIAPAWGEFYEVTGDLRLSACPEDWVQVGLSKGHSRHFLFYLRDETFECDADDWKLSVAMAP